MRATLADAYQLLQRGTIALAKVERNGVKIDVNYVKNAIEKTGIKMMALEKEITSHKIWRKTWKNRFGDKANFTSDKQLAKIVYEDLGFPVKVRTEKGNPAVSKSALDKTKEPFFNILIKYNELDKMVGTFLKGILKETVGGYLHVNYNLNVARTYRSSSNAINFQNFPSRDQEYAELVRLAFIPRFDFFREDDFKGIEVGVSVAYHKDPTLKEYVIKSPPLDMHRDMAMEIYKIPKAELVCGAARHAAKNQYVFPEFYGSYFKQCAPELWETLNRSDLRWKSGPDDPKKTGSGKSILEYLASHGITKLGACDHEKDPKKGTFEYHLKEVEDRFWNERFKVYTAWKKSWYQQYLERGYFDLLTGFRCEGHFARNDVLNYPIQGSAFHCLLWTLIKVQDSLEKYRFKSLLVGQIHDSMEGDIKKNEMRAYHEMVYEIVERKLPKHFPWINVPLKVETEVAPQGQSWFRKKPFHLEAA